MSPVQTRDRPATDQRVLWATAITLVVGYMVLTWLQRIPAVTTRNDDAVYILLSREVASLSYAQSWLLGAPVHSQYPPGYAVWLALLRLMVGERVGVFIAANILLVSAGLLLVFDVLRRHWPPAVGVLFLAVMVVSPQLHDAGALILSEGLYFFLTATALWLAVVKPTGTPWVGMTVLAAITASLTRSIGLAMIMALGACWLLQGHHRRVLVLVTAALVFVGPWVAWTVVAPDKFIGNNYVADMLIVESTGPVSTIGHRLVHHAMAYWTETVPYSLPLATIPGTRVDNLVWLLLMTVLAILGFLRLWTIWRGAAAYLAGYAGLLLIWPWVLGRFLVPIMPFLLVLLLAGLGSPRIRGGWRHALHAATALLLLGIAVGLVQRSVVRFETRIGCDRDRALTDPGCFNDDQRSLLAGALWVNQNLPVDEIIVSGKEGTFAYYSERQVLHTRLIPRTDGVAFLGGMSAAGARYLFLDRIYPMSRKRIGPLLLPVCDQLQVVAIFPPRTYLLAVASPANSQEPGPIPESACAALESFTENSEPDSIPPGWE